MAEGDAELHDLYRDVLIDYFRDPSHKGRASRADLRSHGVNPLCGDEIELTLAREGEALEEVRFTGHGCVISQASSAMMCEAVEGRTAEQARELAGAFKAFMLENAPEGSLPEALEEVRALEGVRKFPVRIKCALLAWNTLLQGLRDEGARESEYQETS